MKRNKDDKRVLRSGNGRQNTTSRRKIRRRSNKNNFNNRPVMHRNPQNRRRKKRKTSKTLMVVMIVALIAFVIGAGIGVSLSFNDNDSGDDQPQFKNVTKEMTTGLNDTEQVYFEKNVDDVDFNENQTSQLDVQYKYSDDN